MVSYRAPPKTVFNLIKGLSQHNVLILLYTSELDKEFKFSERVEIANKLDKNKLKLLNNIKVLNNASKIADVIYIPIAKETLVISGFVRNKIPKIAGPNIDIFPYIYHKPTNFLCDLYLSYNKLLKEELIINLGLNKEMIKILPHAVDTEFYSPNMSNREFWKIFNIGEDKLILLFVGRLEKEKGIVPLLKSYVDYIYPEYKETTLVVVSSGGSYENLIVEMVKKYKSIVFLKLLPEKYMPVVYSSADIGIYPSKHEGFGMVYLESMASGTPTVGVNSGGPREIISNGYDGVLMPDNSEKSIYEAVAYLLENESIRRKIGRHGRKTVEKRYSPRIVAKRFIDICSELLYEDNR